MMDRSQSYAMLRVVNLGVGGGILSSSWIARRGTSGSCLGCFSVWIGPWRPTCCSGRLL